MGNRIVKRTLQHYNEYEVRSDPANGPVEPDKSKSISELSQEELRNMIGRLGAERELESIIRELKRNSGERDTYEDPFVVDTTTPIDQLYHHGIIGMKWGKRRYQNEDGTRTSAGKKRDRMNGRDDRAEEYEKTRVAKKKGIDRFSNEDLRKINERLQLEDTYKRLSAAQMKKSESWVKQSIQKAATEAASDFAKGVFLGSAKLLVKNISPEFATVAFSMKPETSAEPRKRRNTKSFFF